MGWRTSVGRRALILPGMWLVSVLALGSLAGCGGNALPSTPQEANELVVRVSGTEGTAYEGDYSTLQTDPQTVDSTLGNDPTEYPVEVGEDASDGVTAFFRKTQPGGGELKAQILADGEVVVESTTRAEFGSVIVDWLPEAGGPEEDLPEETL